MRSLAEFSFSRAAVTYAPNARLQRKLADELSSFLPREIDGPALDLACGPGIMTQLLMEHFPSAQIDAQDFSVSMLEQLRLDLGDAERLKMILADVDQKVGEGKYGLIVSNSALHWADDLESVFRACKRALLPKSKLVFSMMVDGTLKELREARTKVAPGKQGAGNFPLASNVERSLAKLEFSQEIFRVNSYVEVFPSARDFLRYLNAIGVNSYKFAGARLSRGELLALEREYQISSRINSGEEVFASFEVAFGVFKA